MLWVAPHLSWTIINAKKLNKLPLIIYGAINRVAFWERKVLGEIYGPLEKLSMEQFHKSEPANKLYLPINQVKKWNMEN